MSAWLLMSYKLFLSLPSCYSLEGKVCRSGKMLTCPSCILSAHLVLARRDACLNGEMGAIFTENNLSYLFIS